MRRERRVVAAAMFGVENEREVERLRLQRRVGAGLADEQQQVLGGGLFRIRIANHQGMAAMVVRLGLIGVRRDGRESRDQLHRLPQIGLEVEEIGGRVVGIGSQHGAGDGVHQILARTANDGILLEAFRQSPMLGQNGAPFVELRPRGQDAEQQQIGRLLVAKALLRRTSRDQIVHVDATVEQLARNGLLLAFVHDIAMDVADGGQPHEDACAVLVAETALDAVARIQGRVDGIGPEHVVGTRLQPDRVDHAFCSQGLPGSGNWSSPSAGIATSPSASKSSGVGVQARL